MTPMERATALAKGLPVDRLQCNPNVANGVARIYGCKILELSQSAKTLAQAQVAAYRKFGYDSIRIFTDLFPWAEAMGAKVKYPEDETADLAEPAITDVSQIDSLQPADPYKDGRLPLQLDAMKYLVDEVNKIGLEFGIWFEPEMISRESDLYREHPDWVIRSPLYEPILSRHQLVLDLSNPAVCEYLIEAVSKVLVPGNISYVKWDMNRHLTDLGSAYLDRKNQNELSHRYVLGLYQVMETLTERFPQVLFESCSSGGGRFDAGMLYYMPQTWTSDNTDAVCRLKIQHGTSFLFPTVTMGAHVSACPNHQVGRTTPLATRFAVAAAGNLGYELDLKKLLKEEKKEVREQIAEYKRRRRTVQFGTYYRLADSFQENQSAWNIVSEDGMEVIFTHVQILARSAYRVPVIRLKGLDPDAVYTDCETGQEYGGDELMYAGIRIPRIRQDFSSTTMVLRKS